MSLQFSAMQDEGLSRNSRDTRSLPYAASKIERVGCRQHQRGFIRFVRGRSQPRDGFGQCELLPGNSGNETPATNVATCLEAPIDTHQLSPRGRSRLIGKQIAEHQSIAPKQ